jgi:glyoxylate reductase
LRITGRIDSEVLRQIAVSAPDLDVKAWDGPGIMPRTTLLEWAHEADALLCMLTEYIDAQLLAAAPSLRIVSNMAVGYDNLDLPALTSRQICATNTPDVLTEATAELTMALIFMTMRRLNFAEAGLRQGRWTTSWEPDGFLGVEVQGKTVGLVGYGRIAQAVARRAEACGMIPLIFTRRPLEHLPRGMHQVDWETLLAGSDVISVHVPLTPSTYHLINEDTFAHMNPYAFLVNTSRGAVVDESALALAVESGQIAGAGLDVFEREPLPADSPLRRLPGMVLLPHVGSATVETRRAMGLRAWSNIWDWRRATRPRDLLNPDVWLDGRQ